ncbi:MAG: DMT family transporter [Fimbriimonas sp.]
MTETRRFLPPIALLGALWGPTNLFVKMANDTASPLAVASLRWWIAGAILLLLLRVPQFASFMSLKWPSRAEALQAAAFGAFFFAPAQALYPLALKSTSSLEATVLLATGPVWTALLAIMLLHEKVPARRWLMISVGLVGAYLVAVGFRLPEFESKHAIGNVVYVGAFAWETVAWVLLSRTAKRSSGIGTLACKIVGAMVMFLILSLTLRGDYGFTIYAVNASMFISIGFLILVPALICFSFWYKLAEQAPVSLMAIANIVQPVVGALMGWWFLHEEFTLPTAVGSTLILTALLIGSREGKPSPEVASP